MKIPHTFTGTVSATSEFGATLDPSDKVEINEGDSIVINRHNMPKSEKGQLQVGDEVKVELFQIFDKYSPGRNVIDVKLIEKISGECMTESE